MAHLPGDLLALLDAEEIERTALVCQSMGGWAGLPIAIAHPERLRCLVLCGTPGGLWTDVVHDSFVKVADPRNEPLRAYSCKHLLTNPPASQRKCARAATSEGIGTRRERTSRRNLRLPGNGYLGHSLLGECSGKWNCGPL